MNKALRILDFAFLLVAILFAQAMCGHPLQLVMPVLAFDPSSLIISPDLSMSGMMMGALAPFVVTPELQNIAVRYKNLRLIADDVLPRVPVGVQTFKYRVYSKAEAFTIQDTKVGRTSQPNRVEFSSTETEGTCLDYGLDDPVPQTDIDNAPQGYDPVGQAVESTMDLILLDREARAAALVFAAGNYGSSNKVTLVTNDQWSAYAQTASDPIEDILAGLDACIMRPNIMVIGRSAYSTLIRHPRVMKAVNKSSGDTGIASRQSIKDLFELEDIFVGEGWSNSAKRGQTVSLARLWGDSCALIYRDKLANTRERVTFGYTAQWGSRVAGTEFDKSIGLRGGQMVRVGESVKEVITANDLGYLISDVNA